MRSDRRIFVAIPPSLYSRSDHVIRVYFWFQTELMTYIRRIPSRSSECTSAEARAPGISVYTRVCGRREEANALPTAAEVWYATTPECPFDDYITRCAHSTWPAAGRRP